MKKPGVGLGLQLSKRQTLNQLRYKITKISTDVLLWIGSSQIRDVNQKITSWPCENGNYPLTPVNASNLFDATMYRNRHGCVTTTPYVVAAGHALHNTSVPAIKHFFLLTLPRALAANRMVLTTSGIWDGIGATANASTVTLYGPGWTFYRNGVASVDAPVDVVACYEANKSTNTNTGICLGPPQGSGLYNWTGENYAIAASPVDLTRGQAQAIASTLVDWVKK